MAERTCAVKRCNRTLAPWNKSGRCESHLEFTKDCTWCGELCTGTVCMECLKSGECCYISADLVKCTARREKRGYCSEHYESEVSAEERMCTFPDCSRPKSAFDLCGGHRNQQRAGKELKPLKLPQASLVRDSEGRKKCSMCGQWSPESGFFKCKDNADGLQSRCKECSRRSTVKSKYNLAADAYDRLLEAQNGACAICGGPERSGKAFAVDHDHACCPDPMTSCGRCVRGLLCIICNTAIGTLGDSVEVLEKAIAYLRKHAA